MRNKNSKQQQETQVYIPPFIPQTVSIAECERIAYTTATIDIRLACGRMEKRAAWLMDLAHGQRTANNADVRAGGIENYWKARRMLAEACDLRTMANWLDAHIEALNALMVA